MARASVICSPDILARPACMSVPVCIDPRIAAQGFRIDLAWASVEWIKTTISRLRNAETVTGAHTAVILDTIGPEIRVRPPPASAAADAPGINFAAGSAVSLDRTAGATLTPSTVPIVCSEPFTALAISPGSVLHVSSYLTAGAELTTLSLEVAAVAEDRIDCRVRLACTLPPTMKLTVHGGGVHTHMPILSAEDKQKVAALPPSEAQYLNVSYCRNAADVAAVRDFLQGCAPRPPPRLRPCLSGRGLPAPCARVSVRRQQRERAASVVCIHAPTAHA